MTALSPELAPFVRAQDVARGCLDSAVSELRPGVREVDVAARLVELARAEGAEGCFHAPLVWFGERTVLPAGASRRRTVPGDRALAEGDAVILDYAPVFDGVVADVSRTAACGANAALDELLAGLAELRERLPASLAERGPAGARADLDRWIAAHGWSSCQDGYLFSALGHRVWRLPKTRLSRVELVGLGLPAAARLLGGVALHRWFGRSDPIWGTDTAAPALATGLWSLEPHVAANGVGAKWEELLVVEPDGIRWLDPESPFG